MCAVDVLGCVSIYIIFEYVCVYVCVCIGLFVCVSTFVQSKCIYKCISVREKSIRLVLLCQALDRKSVV